ncbi:hypothetical protein HRF87_04775 [Bacillus sp. CRN 9]|nr:hypothetical protein [Bacillus sp. CRN 9]
MKGKLDKRDKKKVVEFCRIVCMKIKENKQTTSDLFDELYNNIIDEIICLINSGYNSCEATHIVLGKYQSPKRTVEELSESYRIRRILRPTQFFLSFTLLFISIILVFLFYFWNYYYIPKQAEKINNSIPVNEEFIRDGDIDEKFEGIVKNIVNQHKSIQGMWLALNQDPHSETPIDYTYVYPTSNSLVITDNEKIDNPLFNSFYNGAVISLPNSNNSIEIDIEQIQLSSNILYLGLIFFLFYWIIFTNWAIASISYTFKKQNQFVWLIICFNGIGYLMSINHIKKEIY